MNVYSVWRPLLSFLLLLAAVRSECPRKESFEEWFDDKCPAGTKSEEECCKFCSTGFVCENGSVTSIQLVNDQLTGTIPSKLYRLEHLQVLNLSFNMLTGSIPSTLAMLVDLRELKMDGNSLGGAIPSELRALTNLEKFEMGKNLLEGDIPDAMFSDPFPFPNLNLFDVQYNRLEGTVPEGLVKDDKDMTKLETLYLAGNTDFECPVRDYTDVPYNDYIYYKPDDDAPNGHHCLVVPTPSPEPGPTVGPTHPTPWPTRPTPSPTPRPTKSPTESPTTQGPTPRPTKTAPPHVLPPTKTPTVKAPTAPPAPSPKPTTPAGSPTPPPSPKPTPNGPGPKTLGPTPAPTDDPDDAGTSGVFILLGGGGGTILAGIGILCIMCTGKRKYRKDGPKDKLITKHRNRKNGRQQSVAAGFGPESLAGGPQSAYARAAGRASMGAGSPYYEPPRTGPEADGPRLFPEAAPEDLDTNDISEPSGPGGGFDLDPRFQGRRKPYEPPSAPVRPQPAARSANQALPSKLPQHEFGPAKDDGFHRKSTVESWDDHTHAYAGPQPQHNYSEWGGAAVHGNGRKPTDETWEDVFSQCPDGPQRSAF